MKSRKPKAVQPKRVIVLPDQSQLNHVSSSSCKQVSGHTKMSTNCTIHSSVAAHPLHEKKHKNKKNCSPSSKQNPVQLSRGFSNSKSNIKIKALQIPLRSQSHNDSTVQVSYREYCVVEENFVPITSNKEQKLLEDFFAKTASTSYDFNYFNRVQREQSSQKRQPKLRKRSLSSKQQKQEQKKVQIQKQDKAVSNMQGEKGYVSAQVDAVTESCEIGMQYSQRKQVIEQKQVAESVISQQQFTGNQQSLSDLLFKLQFTHLSDDKSFTALTSNEKDHFSQLLETVMTKLQQRQSSLKQKLKPIQFNQPQLSNQKQQQIDQIYESLNSKIVKPSAASAPIVNYQKLQQLIFLRDCVQKNLIQDTSPITSDASINTSLLSVLNFLGHLFCYVEIQYAEEFVYMIRKMYGLTFREKYKKITRNIPFVHDRKFRVVDETVFLDFINQNESSYQNNNEIIHLKAIFDAFNQHLQEYRPYYQGNGQQFPWAFKMFITMSEYSIDEESLQIIFRQAKDKIVEWSTSLCGIIVDHNEPIMLPNNPLQQKRKENQNSFIISWVNDQNFQKDGIQLYSTQTLHQAAGLVFDELIAELLQEANFIFK